jgi:16S rRNA (guanine527-N7)-methyltransferase
MTEDDARDWLSRRDVPRGTLAALDRFVSFLRTEAAAQNLVAASTLDTIYARHIVDSAQLLDLAPAGAWIDLGSGAGFPGLIVAAVGNRPVSLVESRAMRVDFLRRAAEVLEIADRVSVHHARVESIRHAPFSVISARAFAPLSRLLGVAAHLSDPGTVWLLPKGRRADDELAQAQETWQGDISLVPSVTQPDSAVIVARGVSRKVRR